MNQSSSSSSNNVTVYAHRRSRSRVKSEEMTSSVPLIVRDMMNRSGPTEIPINEKSIPSQTGKSSIFKGNVICNIANLSNTNLDYFKGKRRRSQIVIQGRFLKRVKLSEVLYGHLFQTPFANIPHRWLIKKGIHIVKRLLPMLKIDLLSTKPCIYAPLCYLAQTMRKDPPGKAPNIFSEEAHTENCILFGQEFYGLTPIQRRAMFGKHPGMMNELYFDVDHVYTFQFYDNILDLKSFYFDIGYGLRTHLAQYLQGSPMPYMCFVIKPSPPPPPPAAATTTTTTTTVENGNHENAVTVDHVEFLWNLQVFHESNFADCDHAI